MKADFSGYVTKSGLRCSDGRIIMPNAFEHQDRTQVPLVWQHGHTDVENVLGHMILENRKDGVYGYAFFNNTKKAVHAKQLVEHKDINAMSIWANGLVEQAKRVMHGAIREVSLVLAGANPGALIDNVSIAHGDGEVETIADEAIITTGLDLDLEHTDIELDTPVDDETDDDETDDDETDDDETDDTDETDDAEGDFEHSGMVGPDATVQDVYDSLDSQQKQVVHFLIGEALSGSPSGGMAQHADTSGGLTVQDVYDTLTDVQKEVVNFMIGEALSSSNNNSSTDNNTSAQHSDTEKDDKIMGNVFDKTADLDDSTTLSHDNMKAIVADAASRGSLKRAVEAYALAHGIDDIDLLFPDAKAIDGAEPEFLSRRVEWVGSFLSGTRKSPFSRIKTLHADITLEEARAKGYVKGEFKKEEFFGLARRITTPTTVYKKQKLDRDDVVDITDFNVVTWLKAEMRIMLDEEIARAALVGDGRDVSHEDKINEQCIRPIATDNELYTSVINVNIDDASSSVTEIVDAVIQNRSMFKGSGLPNAYMSESTIGKFLVLKDTLGRRIYSTIDDVAKEMRVSSVIPVEVLEEYPTILAIIVNPADYVFGATNGGEVNMFDDFDIDYNQQKYLIETRLCGALTKLKSAIVVKKTAAGDVLVVPTVPTFNAVTGVLTITDTAHVVYKKADGTTVSNAGGPYTVASGDTLVINATPASGYFFATSDDDTWAFTAE